MSFRVGVFVMQKEWLDFISQMAWPAVGLLTIVILGPFGLLERIVSKLSSISTSVEEFKNQVRDLQLIEDRIRNSSELMSGFKEQLNAVEKALGTVQSFTKELVQQSLAGEVGDEDIVQSEVPITGSITSLDTSSAAFRYAEMERQWAELCDLLKERIGPNNFDGRSIAYVAQRLGHRNRKDSIAKEDAALIGSLSAKMKRFRRLQSTKEVWLDDTVYNGFSSEVDRAASILRG